MQMPFLGWLICAVASLADAAALGSGMHEPLTTDLAVVRDLLLGLGRVFRGGTKRTFTPRAGAVFLLLLFGERWRYKPTFRPTPHRWRGAPRTPV
jgi:hypothetical protein